MNYQGVAGLKNHLSLKRFDGDWWRVLLLWILAMLLRYGFFCGLVLCSVGFSRVQAQDNGVNPFQNGEVLQYKVKWAFIRLGTVTIRQQQIDSADTSRFLLRMEVQSTPGLPFINVHFLNQTILWVMDPMLTREDIFSGSDYRDRTTYWYDSTLHRIIMVDSSNGVMTRWDTTSAGCPCYDALGLFMMARMQSRLDTTFVLPTVNDYQIRDTEVRFTDEQEELKVDAFRDRVKARKFSGMAKWVGKSFAGMRGPFRGWISVDEQAVPLKAEIEIFLGSIVMELESIERNGLRIARSETRMATE